jgi:hypothetical protein
MNEVLENTLQGTEFKNANIVINDIAEHFNVYTLNRIARKAACNQAQLFSKWNQRLDLVGHLTALNVHCIWDEFAGKSQTNRASNSDAGLFLSLVS